MNFLMKTLVILCVLVGLAGNAAAVDNIYYPVATEADQGVTGGTTVFDILATVGSTEKATIRFEHSSGGNTTSYTWKTSDTITSNITLDFENGAILVDDADDASLVINSNDIIAGLNQRIFNWDTGTGSLTVGTSEQPTYSAAWFGDASTDIGACIQNAVDANAFDILLPRGSSIPMTSGVLIDKQDVTVRGAGIGSTIIVPADSNFVAIHIIKNHVTLQGFSLNDNRGSDTNDGILIGSPTVGGDRTVLRDISVEYFGDDGIEVRMGNLVTFDNVHSLFNSGNGINFTGVLDVIAAQFDGACDVRGNTGAGLKIIEGSDAHSGGLIVAQGNGTYGLDIAGDGSILTVYTETNTTGGLLMDANSNGNKISLTHLQTTGTPITDNGSNVFFHTNGTGESFIVEGGLNLDASDGLKFWAGGTTGVFTLKQTTAGTPQLELNQLWSSQSASLNLTQTGGNYFSLFVDGGVYENAYPADVSTASNATYTPQNICNRLLVRDPSGSSRTDTLPSATAMVDHLDGVPMYAAFEFSIKNNADAAETITISMGSGGTAYGTMTIAQNYTRRFRLIFSNVSSPQYLLYSLGASQH